MSCGCDKVSKTDLWTAVPPYRYIGDIQPGENIDCYMARTGGNEQSMADPSMAGPKTPDRIDNTSLPAKGAVVDTTFKLTPGSTRTATSWTATVNGQPVTSIPGVSFNASTGAMTGTVAASGLNKNYKVTVTASDATGQIDSREFNFYPKDGKDDTIRFINPLVGPNITVRSGYGPRTHPISGAASVHTGVDLVCGDKSLGDVVAAADGVVTRAGPSGSATTGYGTVICIDHMNSAGQVIASTVYGHARPENIFVKAGQRVSAGQKIAKEGTYGGSTGPHLHFEVHVPNLKFGASGGHHVDPVPYLSGSVSVANNNTGTPDADGLNGVTDGYSTVNNGQPTLSTGEAAARFSSCTPNPTNTNTTEGENSGDATPPTNNQAATRSSCKPSSGGPSKEEVLAKIEQAGQEEGVDAAGIRFMKNVATIESNLDPYAKNPSSSATGLFQFLDSLAVKYYGELGYPVTCETRCDAYKASKAMARFYKKEMLPYWTNFVSSGKSKVAGLAIKPTSFSGSAPPFYAGLDQPTFLYGLIHHDGVGNAKNGVDRGGVAYWRSKVGSA